MTLRHSVANVTARTRSARRSSATALALASALVLGGASPALAVDGDDVPLASETTSISETATVSLAEPTDVPAQAGTVTVVGGFLSDGSTSGAFAPGTTVTVEAGFPDQGMTFTGWTTSGVDLDDAAAARVRFEMPAGDVRLVATYARAFSLAVGLGTINDTEMFGQYAPGEVLRLESFDAPAGQVFARWNVVPEAFLENLADPTSPATTFEMPRSSVLIRASYTVGHELTMSATPVQGGALVGAGQYAVDRTVNIAAIPADGYAFTGWSAVGGGTDLIADPQAVETTVLMPEQSVQLVASFERVTDGIVPDAPVASVIRDEPLPSATPIFSEDLSSAIFGDGYVWSDAAQLQTSPITEVLKSVTFQW